MHKLPSDDPLTSMHLHPAVPCPYDSKQVQGCHLELALLISASASLACTNRPPDNQEERATIFTYTCQRKSIRDASYQLSLSGLHGHCNETKYFDATSTQEVDGLMTQAEKKYVEDEH